MSMVDLTKDDTRTILFALNHWTADILARLKKADDGLHERRRVRLAEVQDIAVRLREATDA